MIRTESTYNKLLKYCYLALLFFLPISLFIDNLALGLLIIFSIINNNYKWFVFLSSLAPFFFYTIFSGLAIGVFNDEMSFYIKLLPLVLIPLATSNIDRDTTEKGYLFLLLGVCLAQLVATYGIIDYYYFTEGKKVALRSYARINDILNFERPYLGFLSAIQIIIAGNLFFASKRKIYFFPILVSIVLIIVISARLAILITVICCAIYMILKIKDNTLRWIIGVGVPLLLTVLIMLSDLALKHRFIQIKNDSRTIIWEGALQQYKNSPSKSFGFSSQQKVDENQNAYYSESANFEYPPDKSRFLEKKYNTHNQYLNELLRGGYFGLLLLLMPFIYVLLRGRHKENPLGLSLVIALAMFLFVENVLERQMGVYLTAIILANAIKYRDET
ncbi:hypothetical protein MTsPCn5_32420 [Croceitalea sp. MTPC5]|uniref:O-antigen ligase family protein n=1 Tax=Croceitalea sp. MTPC5 TaxID=3056565 RepID=UPI002B3C3BAF|nr:hypothetical protein MTsPCn5_32420 [Croceitalea sp. MTPC5]